MTNRKTVKGESDRCPKDLVLWDTSVLNDAGYMELQGNNILGSSGLSTRCYLGRRKQ